MGFERDDEASVRIGEWATKLERESIGIEPDTRWGARKPKLASSVILFPLPAPRDPDSPRSEYVRAAATVFLLGMQALEGGRTVSPEEIRWVREMIDAWKDLRAGERARLHARYRLQILNPASLSSMKIPLADLTVARRMDLVKTLCARAAAGGALRPARVRFLEQVYRSLEIDPALVYRHLQAAGAPSVLPDRAGRSGPAEAPAWSIDPARLAELRRETEQVGELLATVFTGEEAPPAPPPQPSPDRSSERGPEGRPEGSPLPGLDRMHHEFLSLLLERGSWPRGELEELARGRRIMLDGALEHINDAAFDHLGEALLEGDDPVTIHLQLLEDSR